MEAIVIHPPKRHPISVKVHFCHSLVLTYALTQAIQLRFIVSRYSRAKSWRGNHLATRMHIAFAMLWSYVTATYTLALLTVLRS